jgi:hypothetical protein
MKQQRRLKLSGIQVGITGELCLSKISKCLRGRELFFLCTSWEMLFPQPDHEGRTVGGPR